MSNISVGRAKKLFDKGGKLIDVRSPVDFMRNGIAGSINLPLRNISHVIKHAKQVDTIILVGDKSSSKDLEMAEKYTIQLGFTNVFVVLDIEQWDVPTLHK
jgi:rhodanese-related sulfurtransferase